MIKQILLFNLFSWISFCQLIGQQFVIDESFQPDYDLTAHPFSFISRQGVVADVYELENDSLMIFGNFYDHLNFPYHIGLIKTDNSGLINPDYILDFISPPLNLSESYWRLFVNDSVFYVTGFDGNYFERFDFDTWVKDPVFGEVYHNSFPAAISPQDIRIQPDGKILLGGWFQNIYSSNGLIRINEDASLDTTFNHHASYIVWNFLNYDENSYLINGKFSYYDGEPANSIIRVDNYGNRDVSFDCPIYGDIYDYFVQEDGKIIIGGAFIKYEDISLDSILKWDCLIRLNSDGSIDSTFRYKNNFYNDPYDSTLNQYTGVAKITALCPIENNKFLVGGIFKSCQGIERGNIALIDSNGILDTLAFNHTGFDTTYSNNYPAVLCIVPSKYEGKYYVGGGFTGYNGSTTQCLVRLKEVHETIDENNPQKDFVIYPNPAKSEIRIKFPAINLVNQIDLISIDGKILQSLLPNSDSNTQVIQIENYSSGTYIIQIETNHSKFSKLFIKN